MTRIWFSAVSFFDLAQQVLYPPRIAADLLGADRGTHPVRRKSHTNDGTKPRETSVTKRILIIDDQRRVLDVLRELVASFQHKHA
jgi:hypothetical protein